MREARDVEEALGLLRDAGEVDSNVGPEADAGPESRVPTSLQAGPASAPLSRD